MFIGSLSRSSSGTQPLLRSRSDWIQCLPGAALQQPGPRSLIYRDTELANQMHTTCPAVLPPSSAFLQHVLCPPSSPQVSTHCIWMSH
ncbi:hypothetical protein AV530_013875 [Patagioenas fasciata monilis]|uniref:Uncharacterized protein n=1 Tax=Patagioenas fasciata monilis TaxID=372326 RepID=A0A1V4KMW6_PATFA|nr:hypothetical protein AV530_013875 [Patagioenas fasciata monilis]